MSSKTVILTPTALHRALTRIAHEIAERNEESQCVALIGVQRGGVHLAGRLAPILEGIWGHPVPVGQLDVSMHRDDLDQRTHDTGRDGLPQ
jgi:pyrimidine operon attenuation protein / uracil phosphoribosyltransferase